MGVAKGRLTGSPIYRVFTAMLLVLLGLHVHGRRLALCLLHTQRYLSELIAHCRRRHAQVMEAILVGNIHSLVSGNLSTVLG